MSDLRTFARRSATLFSLLLSVLLFAQAAAAQSPNTASMIVVVVDQNDAVVRDAKVTVSNNATGDVREAVSDGDGSVTIPALSLTGTYTVAVTREGFGGQELKDVTLRSGETATVKVRLLVGAQSAEVTVFGTTEGVRDNPQTGLPLNAAQGGGTAFRGRRGTRLPLLNWAFRVGKGAGGVV